jgi:hypothetical protein
MSGHSEHRFHKDSFSPRKLVKEVKSKEQYHVQVSTSFAALGNNINRALKPCRENIKISVKGSQDCYVLTHKPWFEEGCSEVT